MSLEKHKSYPALQLEYFIDQLAEYIVLESDTMCPLCARGSCDSQVSGLTCRNGVQAWLMERKAELVPGLSGEIQREFEYLDALRRSGAVNMYGAVPYLQNAFPGWSREWYTGLLRLWMDTCQERTEEQ